MSQLNLADLQTEINSVVTSQTSPDTITQSTLGGLLADMADSAYNKEDGITVDGMTSLLTGIENGDQLNSILNVIQATILQINGGNNGVIPNIFSAKKTGTQTVPTAITTGGSCTIVFEDDFTTPQFDNSNLFHFDKFVANGQMTKIFAIEKLALKHTSPSGAQWALRILKNGTAVKTSATITSSTQDAYLSQLNSTGGYTFPALVSDPLQLDAGDVVTAEVYYVLAGGGSTIEILSGEFNNS